MPVSRLPPSRSRFPSALAPVLPSLHERRGNRLRRSDSWRRSRGTDGRALARPLPAPRRRHRLRRPTKLGDARRQRFSRAPRHHARGVPREDARRVSRVRCRAHRWVRRTRQRDDVRLRDPVRPDARDEGARRPPRLRAPRARRRTTHLARRRGRSARSAIAARVRAPRRVAESTRAAAGVRKRRARLSRLRRLRHARQESRCARVRPESSGHGAQPHDVDTRHRDLHERPRSRPRRRAVREARRAEHSRAVRAHRAGRARRATGSTPSSSRAVCTSTATTSSSRCRSVPPTTSVPSSTASATTTGRSSWMSTSTPRSSTCGPQATSHPAPQLAIVAVGGGRGGGPLDSQEPRA